MLDEGDCDMEECAGTIDGNGDPGRLRKSSLASSDASRVGAGARESILDGIRSNGNKEQSKLMEGKRLSNSKRERIHYERRRFSDWTLLGMATKGTWANAFLYYFECDQVLTRT